MPLGRCLGISWLQVHEQGILPVFGLLQMVEEQEASGRVRGHSWAEALSMRENSQIRGLECRSSLPLFSFHQNGAIMGRTLFMHQHRQSPNSQPDIQLEVNIGR